MTVNTLLTFETEGTAKLKLRGDAVLYEPVQTSRPSYSSYVPTCNLYAMSVVGPEQAIRALGMGCAQDGKNAARPVIFVTGPEGKRVKCRWAPRWAPRCMMLTEGSMHMVAVPPVTVSDDLVQTDQKNAAEVARDHVIIAAPRPGEDPVIAMRRAIYERLMLAYTTPLIPINLPGQPEHERAAGAKWAERLAREIMEDSTLWTELRGHPEQTEETWRHAGLLSLSQKRLDDLVCALVRARSLTIPRTEAA